MGDPDFEHQLQLEAQEACQRAQQDSGQSTSNVPYTYTDPTDGTVYEWDHEKRAWFPKISEDFIVMYQTTNYGYKDSTVSTNSHSVTNTPSSVEAHDSAIGAGNANSPVSTSTTQEIDSLEKPSSSATSKNDETFTSGLQILKKKGLKNSQKRPASWFELDDSRNSKVYVSGLPLENFNEDKFVELMSKYGMVLKDDSNRYRVKLYRDSNGSLKGDGLCTYIKIESVDLAIQLLDGSEIEGNVIHVERAKFELKGDFDPSKKPKQMKKKDKEKMKKKIDKLFAWKPDKLRGERSKCENTVIIKNFFSPKDFDEDARLILEYQKDLREECESKFGEVRKIVLYDRNPDGVAAVTFKEVEHADACVATMHGRFFAGRQLQAFHWDGKESFKIVETEEQLEERLKKWDEFLQQD